MVGTKTPAAARSRGLRAEGGRPADAPRPRIGATAHLRRPARRLQRRRRRDASVRRRGPAAHRRPPAHRVPPVAAARRGETDLSGFAGQASGSCLLSGRQSDRAARAAPPRSSATSVSVLSRLSSSVTSGGRPVRAASRHVVDLALVERRAVHLDASVRVAANHLDRRGVLRLERMRHEQPAVVPMTSISVRNGDSKLDITCATTPSANSSCAEEAQVDVRARSRRPRPARRAGAAPRMVRAKLTG